MVIKPSWDWGASGLLRYVLPSQIAHCLFLSTVCGEVTCYVWQIICMTNFEGEERRQVKQMITLIGAKYTGYMTRANSVLIAKQ